MEIDITYSKPNRVLTAPVVVIYRNGNRLQQIIPGKKISLEVKEGTRLELRMGLLATKFITVKKENSNYIIQSTTAQYFNLILMISTLIAILLANSYNTGFWFIISIIASLLVVVYLAFKWIQSTGGFKITS